MSVFETRKVYWIGPRESDIEAVKNLFAGSITIFGSNKDGNFSFCNEKAHAERVDHNNAGKESDDFMVDMVLSILEKNPDAKFMFYNANVFYAIDGFSKIKEERPECFICLNNETITKKLNDKNEFRDNYIPQIKDAPHYDKLNIRKAKSNECRYDTICEKFEGVNEKEKNTRFIFQAPVASGGHGTFILTHSKNTEAYIRSQIKDSDTYLVSVFQENNVSVNLHAIIYEKDIVISPGSVQIMHEDTNRLLYRGADFIAYRSLNEEMREVFIEKAMEICKLFQKDGYRGVCGIDAIFSKGKVFLLEVNNRFQASTNLLNFALIQNGYKSIQEMNAEAFYGKQYADAKDHEISDIEVNFSNYSFINNEVKQHNRMLLDVAEKDLESDNGNVFSINYDGFKKGEESYTSYAHLYRINFNTNISWINEDQLLNVSEHITDPYYDWYEKICKYAESKDNQLALKIALMMQGVRFSKEAEERIYNLNGVRSATNNAIDMIITDISADERDNDLKDGKYKNAGIMFVVNAPINIKFNEFTPFEIVIKRYEGLEFFALKYYDKYLTCIQLFPEDEFKHKKTSNGVEYSKIAFLSTDRLRVHLTNNCKYKQCGKGCKFCNMAVDEESFTLADIEEVISDYRTNCNEVNHYLIGGQSMAESDGAECVDQQLINITKIIRKYDSQGRIYAMILPVSSNTIQELRYAGVNEFAFNIEIYDKACSEKYMPGKSKYSRDKYFETLKRAAMYTDRGDTRSLLVVGLEPEKSMIKCIEKLAKSGIQPILSVFRPLPDTELADVVPPPMQNMFKLYHIATSYCEANELQLGPECIYCQNNTLSMPY